MQSSAVRITPSESPRETRYRGRAARTLFGAFVVTIAALVLWYGRVTPTIAGDLKNLPLTASVGVIVAICIAALAALEFGRRNLALLLVAPVVAAITATITAWVLGLSPPFGFTLFGDPSVAPSWFPLRPAIEAAMPTALLSLAILLLSIEKFAPTVAPFAWATGALLMIAPPIRFALLANSDDSVMDFLNAQRVELVLSAAFVLVGWSLIESRAVAASRTVERGARWRALLLVAAIATTVALWYAVRATEIRQLRSDVEFALEETVRSLQAGLDDNSVTVETLWQHWRAMQWQVPDDIFLRDARIYMQHHSAAAAVAMLDPRGGLLKLARRATVLGTPHVPEDLVILAGPMDIPPPLADPAVRANAALEIFASKARTRGSAVAPNGTALRYSFAPVLDEQQTPLGIFWVLYRRDVMYSQILNNIAPDFHIRMYINGDLVYGRPPRGGAYQREDRFRIRETRAMSGLTNVFEIAPGEKIVERALGWTPLLVLLFAWASLVLLMFALYNERRVHLLYRDRERILNQSSDMICTVRTNGQIVTVNDAVRSILGLDPQTLTGRSLAEFVVAGRQEQMRQQWFATTTSEGQTGAVAQTAPTPFVRRDGRNVYLQCSSRWSAAEQLFYCSIRDVTAEHESQLQRQHAENTFRIGVAQAGCAVYEYQPDPARADGGRIEWVGAIRALTGYDPEELPATDFERWMQLVHPDDGAHVRQILSRCLETHQPHTVDYRLRRKDGAYVPVLDRGRHLAESSNDRPRMIGALIDLTAIRQQEIALRRSEERYRIIAGQVGAVIIERETATGRVRAFGPVEQIFGYTKEQLESRPLNRGDTMIHPDDRAHYFAAVDAAERTLSSYYVEHRRRHRGGHYIYIASRGVVLPGPDGKAEREVIAITDISERKQAETRLSESEERFRLAAEQARQIVYEFIFGENMQIAELRFAGAIDRVLGYTPAELRELQGRDRFALIHPEDVALVRNAGTNTADGGQHYTVEHRILHHDGYYVHVENRGAVKRDAHGAIVGIVGMLLDITPRRAAEADRQQYTAQLQALSNIAHRVASLLSLHELFKYLSTSMRELLGANAAAAMLIDPLLAPEQVVAVSYADSYGPQRGIPAVLGTPELIAQVRTTNAPQRYTAKQMADDPVLAGLTMNDDLRHPLRGWLGAPLIARDGVNLGTLEISDKTEGDFTEGDLQVLNQLAGIASVAIENIRLYATLEERVTARTRELEISNRELEAFSYSVSHDLRAPLRAIAGFSSILESEYGAELDTTARRYLQRITAGVERMANLIDDLLSLARVSRAELKRETVDVTALCKAIVKRQAERYSQRTFHITVDPKMKAIADPRLVEVAFENLIENALKFTSTRAQAEIRVGHRRVDGRPVFFVSDNGVGFDPKYAANLFGVFQRLHSANDFPGTGVGLATVQRIVQRHQGRIWAEAEIDRGATFYCTFSNEA
jgi:PAS domain S-box-containing protein